MNLRKSLTEKSIEETNTRFNMNAECLWIWRSLGVTFSVREEMK